MRKPGLVAGRRPWSRLRNTAPCLGHPPLVRDRTAANSLEVKAGAERGTRPPDDHHLDAARGAHELGRRDQFFQRLGTEGIQSLRPGKRDTRDRSGEVEHQRRELGHDLKT